MWPLTRERAGVRAQVGSVLWLLAGALLVVACGAGAGNGAAAPSPTPPAVGWNGEVEDAPYIAFETVSYERLPKERLEPAGEVRIPQEVRRVAAFRLRDSGTHAIRYTDDAGRGWLAWQPTIVLNARRELAQRSGVQPGQVVTLGVWREEWPDTCLGVPAGGTCRTEPTPGFRITLRAGSTTETFHTDLREHVVRAPA